MENNKLIKECSDFELKAKYEEAKGFEKESKYVDAKRCYHSLIEGYESSYKENPDDLGENKIYIESCYRAALISARIGEFDDTKEMINKVIPLLYEIKDYEKISKLYYCLGNIEFNSNNKGLAYIYLSRAVTFNNMEKAYVGIKKIINSL